MNISKEEHDEYIRLKQSDQFEESVHNSSGMNFSEVNKIVTERLSDKTPVLVPRNTLLLVAGGVGSLILLTWPVIIVAYILGVATIVKLGCPCGLTGKDKS